MWKQLWEALSKVIALAQRTDALEKKVKNQEQELKDLSVVVRHLAFEIQRLKDEQKHAAEREASERKLFQLQIENQLLKAGRQLPPTPAGDDEENGK